MNCVKKIVVKMTCQFFYFPLVKVHCYLNENKVNSISWRWLSSYWSRDYRRFQIFTAFTGWTSLFYIFDTSFARSQPNYLILMSSSKNHVKQNWTKLWKKWLERLNEWNLANAKYAVNAGSLLHKIYSI